jgi:hypothetical protein
MTEEENESDNWNEIKEIFEKKERFIQTYLIVFTLLIPFNQNFPRARTFLSLCFIILILLYYTHLSKSTYLKNNGLEELNLYAVLSSIVFGFSVTFEMVSERFIHDSGMIYVGNFTQLSTTHFNVSSLPINLIVPIYVGFSLLITFLVITTLVVTKDSPEKEPDEIVFSVLKNNITSRTWIFMIIAILIVTLHETIIFMTISP